MTFGARPGEFGSGDEPVEPAAKSHDLVCIEQAFQYFKLGKASAAVVLFFALIVGLTLAQWFLFRRRLHYTT